MLLGARLAIFGGAQNPPSPKYDALLDYVQGAGVVHSLDTGIPAKSAARIEIRFSQDDSHWTTYGKAYSYLLYSTGTTSNNPMIRRITNARNDNPMVYSCIVSNSTIYRSNVGAITAADFEEAADWVLSRDGISRNGIAIPTSAYSGSPSSNLFLFGGGASYICTAKMFYCRIYTNDGLVRDFRPAIKDNVACLWDAVTDELYYPTTGELIAGNPIS